MKIRHPQLRTSVTRYVTPLREGGSLPAIVEADDQLLANIFLVNGGAHIRFLISFFQPLSKSDPDIRVEKMR